MNGKTIPALGVGARSTASSYQLYQSQMGERVHARARRPARPRRAGAGASSWTASSSSRRRGAAALVVSDDELSSAVHAIPAFQQNGALPFRELRGARARQNFGSAREVRGLVPRPAPLRQDARRRRRDGEGLRRRGEGGVAGRRRQGRAHVRPVPARRVPGRGEAVRRRGEGVRGQGGRADRAVLQGERRPLRPEEEGPRPPRPRARRARRATTPPRRRRSRTPPPA